MNAARDIFARGSRFDSRITRSGESGAMKTMYVSEMKSQSPHTERFSGRAQAYEEYRERYDPDVVLLRPRKWSGLALEWTIADVG